MNIPFVRTVALCLVLFAVVACRTDKVMTVENAVLDPPARATLADIGTAIRRAGAGLGWQMAERQPGRIEGTLRLRSHVAVVDVLYDRSTLSIRYKDSTNLNYSATDQTIHSNYNGWIDNLKNAIQAQVTAI